MNFDFVLRDGKSPTNDKPKIFMYLPSEYAHLFDVLTEIFLASLDSVIYYPKKCIASLGVKDFKSIDLFAILIPSCLNENETHAIDKLCQIANINKIAVFFFRISEVELSIFESRYGCLHVFDASGFEEKKQRNVLINYLRRTLFNFFCSDEEINEIKKNFNACFFLSYRKKDRCFLETFLNTAYDYPLFRDVAIWYDDALVPGEDYNKSIENELKNSDLVLMIVTDSLLENNNYVVTVEYPLSKRYNKPIVPFCFNNPDSKLLLEKLPSLPHCIDSKNPQELGAALEKICIDYNIKEPNDSPKHLYFMGLAYLWGIGVKKNEMLSLSLIRSSALNGHLDALFRAASIYANGNGVEKDYRKAIFFYENYIYNAMKKVTPLPSTFIGDEETLSKEEYDEYESAKKIIYAMKMSLLLYKATGLFSENNIRGCFVFCKRFITNTNLFCAEAATFSRITGYETIQDKSGKQKVGNAKFSDVFVLISFLPYKDLIELLHMLIFDFQDCRRFEEILGIINAYETACTRMENDKRFHIALNVSSPIFKELIMLCDFVRDYYLSNDNFDAAKLFEQKSFVYKNTFYKKFGYSV